MNYTYPSKLKAGDEIRIISPSNSMSIIGEQTQQLATQRLEALGFKVTFGKHVNEADAFNSSTIQSRVSDLHEAFNDTNVKGILTVVGGFNSNQLLPYIDWSIIRDNPKVFCGYSDISALNNAMLAKTGLVSYSGLHYATFGMERYFEYCLDYFKKCLMSDDPINIQPSVEWTDDLWFLDQDKRTPIHNDGWLMLNEGEANGSIRGGNLCTLNLLQGTQYMPDLDNVILFIEDDSESLPHHFDRNLVSLIQQPNFGGVKGIVLGRFQKDSNFSNDLIRQMIQTKQELKDIPIIANVDFGHTNTIITFPIGGEVQIKASEGNPSILIAKH
jgi:muramoyltetrapeptide carboxypeptidase